MKINNKNTSLIFTAIIFISIVLINLIGRNWFVRFDLTDNAMYSLSSSSISVVKNIDDPLTVKIYFSDQLPNEYANNRRYLQDILEEYSAYSNGNLRFEFFIPESDEDLSNDAQKYGIQPVQLQVVENDKVEIKKVYMGLVILYEDQREAIPIIQTTTGLEYDLTTKIKKLIDVNKENIGLVNHGINGTSVSNQNLIQQLNERYTVLPNIALNNPISEDVNLLLMNGTTDSLSIDEESNLKSFLSRGGNLFIAQNKIIIPGENGSLDLSQQPAVIESNIFNFLANYGLEIKENLVLDQVCNKINIPQQVGPFRMNVPTEYPFLPILKKFNSNDVSVSDLESMMLYFPSEIKSDSIYSNQLVSFTPLVYSSNKSLSMTSFYNLNPDPNFNPSLNDLNQSSKLLGARVVNVDPNTQKENKITLIADSKFFTDQISSYENSIFIMNTIDYLIGDSELIALRSREVTDRPLIETDNNSRLFWKILNMILPPLFIILLGLFLMRKDRKKSQQLELMYEK